MDKIDIVILWVDDNDINWREKKKYWQREFGIIDDQDERYRNWDNLKYLFRGIEKYASWVNHVYLVTDNQKPEWLNIEYKKVTVVDHTEILNNEYLPTFNSSAIEINIHRIKGLSNKFIYLNDDIFFIDKLKPQDFFVRGLPRDRGALNLIMPIKDNRASQVVFNNTTLINNSFDKRQTLLSKPFKWFNPRNGLDTIRTFLLFIWPYFSGFKQVHLTGNFLKSSFEEVWSEYSKELTNTSKSKFRKFSNYNIELIRGWQLASNQFIPQKLGFGKLFQLTDKDSIDKCAKHIRKKRTKVVCVNDTEYLVNFEYAKKIINKELAQLFPDKSKYEK